MSEKIHHAAHCANPQAEFDPPIKRAHVVAIALELIKARAESGAGTLHQEMENLSDYADKIQAALEVK